jgi:hypothetical protein
MDSSSVINWVVSKTRTSFLLRFVFEWTSILPILRYRDFFNSLSTWRWLWFWKCRSLSTFGWLLMASWSVWAVTILLNANLNLGLVWKNTQFSHSFILHDTGTGEEKYPDFLLWWTWFHLLQLSQPFHWWHVNGRFFARLSDSSPTLSLSGQQLMVEPRGIGSTIHHNLKCHIAKKAMSTGAPPQYGVEINGSGPVITRQLDFKFSHVLIVFLNV